MSDWKLLNSRRIRSGDYKSDETFGFNGAFWLDLPCEPKRVLCVASDGMGWQHVSVSFGADQVKTPKWDVMCAVKDLFWEPEDVVVQFHPAKSKNVSYHPGCLHLWRCIDGRQQPLPLPIMVGPTPNELPK